MTITFSVVLFLVATILLVLAILVHRSPSRGYMQRFFAFFMAMSALWSVGLGVFLAASSPMVAYFAATGYYIAAALIAYLLVLLALALPVRQNQRQVGNRIVWSALSLPAVVMVTLTLTPVGIISGITVGEGQNTVALNAVGYATYSWLFVGYSVLAITILMRKIIRSSARLRLQNSIIAGSVGFGLIFGAYFNLILPLFGNYGLIWVGPLAGIPIVAVVFYSIMRYSLFDIRQTAARTVAYALSLSSVLTLYYVISLLLSGILFRENPSFEQSLVNMGIVVVTALSFAPFKHLFDRLTNRVFYRGSYDTNTFFARLNEVLTGSIDLRSLLSQSAELIAGTMNAAQATFYILRDESRYTSSGTSSRVRLLADDVWAVTDYLGGTSSGALFDSALAADHALRYAFSAYKISAILPLRSKGETVGFLALGQHQGRGYRSRDERALNTVADSLVIAVQNALSLQKVKELNSTLQQRIDSATQELRDRNERLRQMDATKDEFISMASHQLRTPLTSIKGYISMVLEGDAGAISRPQRQLLGEAFTSSERMVHLIGDFLNVSRLQNGKFIIDRHESNLAKVVQQEVDSIQQIARSHGMRIVYRIPRSFPTLYIDEGKLRQVVMNFIDNAIYYSPNTTVIKVSLAVEDGDVVLRVVDHGIGVPHEVQKKLFTKFFRAGNARTQRPDGTGIGLYLARKVIDGHGGQVVFESTEGQGSTFGFRLPIHDLSHQPESEF